MKTKTVCRWSSLFLLIFAISGYWSPVIEAKITKETAATFDRGTDVFDRANPRIQNVMAVQDRHNRELMEIPDVVGTATGLNEEGEPAILVFTRKSPEPGRISERLEGVPVSVKVTGEILAMRPSKPSTVDGTAIFSWPVPIGVSTGNTGECSAGTIGARVKRTGGYIYALSNNHVYALENTASFESEVVQPGLYDTQCLYNGNNSIGKLSSFVPINFSGGNNKVDAAIALSGTDRLGNATPSNGYGTPNSITVSAILDQTVQKYGRTSSLTTGTITGINATIIVSYGSSGNAKFVNQITVSSNKPFIKAGDSGSLLVTNDQDANPVGLLFAGTLSGKFAVANQIEDVLSLLNVAIDGK